MKTNYNIIRTSDGLLVIIFNEKRAAEQYVMSFNKKYEEKGFDFRLKIVIGDLFLEEKEGKIVVKNRNGRKFTGESK